jgi:hypothetical protein
VCAYFSLVHSKKVTRFDISSKSYTLALYKDKKNDKFVVKLQPPAHISCKINLCHYMCIGKTYISA